MIKHNIMTKGIKGFSLIELVVVIVVLGVISTMVGEILYHSAQSVATTYDVSNISTQSRVALERMAREIRMIRSSDDLTTVQADEIDFVDVNGVSISYSLSGTDLLRNSNVLAKQIASLAFAYQDSEGNDLTFPVTAADVRYVKVSLNATENDANIALQTTVFLRNISE
jgi:prepilin-type N-terminal cleavage/methylation domain-containing protein